MSRTWAIHHQCPLEKINWRILKVIYCPKIKMKFIWKKSGIPQQSLNLLPPLQLDTTHCDCSKLRADFFETEESGQLNENQPRSTCLALAKTAPKHWPIPAPLMYFFLKGLLVIYVHSFVAMLDHHTHGAKMLEAFWCPKSARKRLSNEHQKLASKASPTTLKNSPEMSCCVFWKIPKSPFSQIAWVWWRCTCKQSSTAWRLTVKLVRSVIGIKNQDIGSSWYIQKFRPTQNIPTVEWKKPWFHLPFC